MRDETLVEPFAVSEIYCDGVDHVVSNGMMMASGYRIMPPARPSGEPVKVVVVRLILKVESVPDTLIDAREALNSPFVPVSKIRRLVRH